MPLEGKSVAEYTAECAKWATNHSRSMTIGVAIDGSDACTHAYIQAAKMSRPHCNIRLLHVAPLDDAKEDYRTGRDHLIRQFDMLHSTLIPSTNQTFHVKQRPSADTATSKILLELAQEHDVDILFIGTFGRKGTAGRIEERGGLQRITSMGSTATTALREAPCNICLTSTKGGVEKATQAVISAPTKWCLATDMGASSTSALFSLVTNVATEGDAVHTIAADFDDKSADAVKQVGEFLKTQTKVKGSVEFVQMPCQKLSDATSVPEALVFFAEENKTDFLVVGVVGSKPLGSVMSDVVKDIGKLNILLYKSDTSRI